MSRRSTVAPPLQLRCSAAATLLHIQRDFVTGVGARGSIIDACGSSASARGPSASAAQKLVAGA